MKKVEYKKIGGPYGDATSNYEVITDAKTVGELIDALLPNDNFATFVLRTPDGSFDNELCMCYAQDGIIVRRASKYDSLTSMKVIKVRANGGWGNMLYDITIDGELPKQDREENFILTEREALLDTALRMIGIGLPQEYIIRLVKLEDKAKEVGLGNITISDAVDIEYAAKDLYNLRVKKDEDRKQA